MAKNKANLAKRQALEAYLEVNKIKENFMINEIHSDSDEELYSSDESE